MKYGKLLIIFSLMFALLGLVSCGKKKEEDTKTASVKEEKAPEIIKIGILTDLSGSLVSQGTDIKNASIIGAEQINKYFKDHGYNYELKILVEDTQINPSLCLKKVQALSAKGVRLFVGPMASGEVKNIASYVTSNKLIIISPSSTAIPALIGFAKPEDKKYIFRFVPNDEFQGRVIAKEIKGLGYKKVAVLYREDAWGRGLKNAVVKNLMNYGIEILGEIAYPSTPEPSDWSPYIQKLTNFLEGQSPNDTAVVTVCFEELATLLSQVNKNSPILNYIWFGSDGNVKSDKILKEAKEKAIKVKLYSTIFHGYSDAADKLLEEFKKRGFGESIDQYALCAYDALWVGAISYAEMLKELGHYDADYLSNQIRENVVKYSNGEFGVKPVTGIIAVNEWNDRSKGDYAIWSVTPEGWVISGIWHSSTDKIEWLKK